MRWTRRSRPRASASDIELDVDDLKTLVDHVQGRASGSIPAQEFPQHPREQLDMAIRAVFDSWNTDRARLYRRRERIPQNLGTAVNICTMVFGNLGETSGTGVAFTRDPASGQTGAYGDYLSNAQGEDVVAGIRNTLSLDDLQGAGSGLAQAADQGDAPAGDALPGPVRHRVHHRARQAVDAADPGRQAHRGRRVPDRRAAGRRDT